MSPRFSFVCEMRKTSRELHTGDPRGRNENSRKSAAGRIRYANGLMAVASPTNTMTEQGPSIAAKPPSAGSSEWWRRLLQIVLQFDKKKMRPQMALRNTAGVILPLIAGYALGMPRGGLAMASGALNVSYSDGSDPYAQRAKRMLASTVWCSIAVLLGGLTAHSNTIAVIVATLWAFTAGMLVALGSTAGD